MLQKFNPNSLNKFAKLKENAKTIVYKLTFSMFFLKKNGICRHYYIYYFDFIYLNDAIMCKSVYQKVIKVLKSGHLHGFLHC